MSQWVVVRSECVGKARSYLEQSVSGATMPSTTYTWLRL
eukprot:SAG11_NODE_31861_length_288_cov_1.089947_1_plen_38_part_01